MVQKIFFSYWMTIVLLSLLAIGAGVATFIENDFGSSTARVLVYNHFWYELILTLTVFNLMGIMTKVKMIKSKAKFIFHSSFVVMLIGAAMTRYYGYEGVMHIREGETTNQMISLEPCIHVTTYKDGKAETTYFEKDFSALGGNDFSYHIPLNGVDLEINFVHYQLAKNAESKMGLVTLEAKYKGESQQVRVVGQRGMRTGVVKDIVFKDGTKISLEYGSKPLELPFAIKLNNFELERYPGSMAPSSYSSKVEVVDKANNEQYPFHIYMNNILYHNGFKFFQSSYDPDELGTVLSVNHDIGHWPTYFGYFLLLLGLVMNLFDKESRFIKLTRYIAKVNQTVVISAIALVALFGTTNMQATVMQPNNLSNTVNYLEKYKDESKVIAEEFSHLIVQADMGRMKPIDTLSKEILNKLTKQSEFLGMNGNQVVLGMLTNPDIWKDIKIIKIDTPKLKEYLGLPSDRKYVAFSEILGEDGYKLAKLLEEVSKIDPNQRGTFEKDAIKVDERVNIIYMIFISDMFKIYPKIQDPQNQWMSPGTAIKTLVGQDKEVVWDITRTFISNVSDGDYINASKSLKLIAMYQQKFGSNIYPSQTKIDAELMFNKLDIFPRLTLAYLILGVLMFVIAFVTVFKQNLSSTKLNNILFGLLALLFLIQTIGMGFRWYISGHAPWSDTYESLVYIAWSIMFAGVVFFRKSLMALSATVVMTAVFMFTAHLSGIDPQITNLVPVLKSYWLTIHVSIITGSYGFLALGGMLGFMALILFIFRNEHKPHIDKTIKHITAINEASLIIGLSALIVGNFLGGVWANESWGRYWGWDPKETWAYVAIIVYAIVLHLRLIPKLNRPYIFAVASTLAFSTILMTYFGVNFYLSGMHSYATGDPVPIPTWVYVLTGMVFTVIALAYRKKELSIIKL